jgi:hypothetical protein
MKGFRLGKPASSLYHLAVLHLLRGTTLHNFRGTEQKLPPKLCHLALLLLWDWWTTRNKSNACELERSPQQVCHSSSHELSAIGVPLRETRSTCISAFERFDFGFCPRQFNTVAHTLAQTW